MKKNIIFIVFITFFISIIIALFIKRKYPDIIPPSITIDKERSTIKDIIYTDYVKLYIKGNRPQSLINIYLDDNINEDWYYGGAIFGFNNLRKGKHTIHIHTRYFDGSKVTDYAISFEYKN